MAALRASALPRGALVPPAFWGTLRRGVAPRRGFTFATPALFVIETGT